VRETTSTFWRKILEKKTWFRIICFVRSQELTSGVPYERLLWNAVSDEISYFSAKPKSTRTGMFLWETSMFAGLDNTIRTIIMLSDE